MPGNVGQRLLHDAVDRDVNGITQRLSAALDVKPADDAGALFPGLAKFLQGRGQAERVERDGAQAAKHVAHELVQPLRRDIGALGCGQHAGPVIGRAMTQAGGFDADRGAALAELVVQLTRQGQALGFLQRDQLAGQFAVVLQQVGAARFGTLDPLELHPGLVTPPQRIPRQAAGQHGDAERQFIGLPILEPRQTMRQRLIQLQGRCQEISDCGGGRYQPEISAPSRRPRSGVSHACLAALPSARRERVHWRAAWEHPRYLGAPGIRGETRFVVVLRPSPPPSRKREREQGPLPSRPCGRGSKARPPLPRPTAEGRWPSGAGEGWG